MNKNSKIIVAFIITALLAGALFYWLQMNQEDLPIHQDIIVSTDEQTQVPPLDEESQDATPEETQVLSPEETQAPQVEKTFEGNNFSFIYPVDYIADDKGLWTKERYELHTNPSETCDICHIPDIELKATTSASIDQQIISDFDLPGTTLSEMSEQTGIQYENLKIGNNDFIKITVRDMFDVTAYYTINLDQVLAFRVYWTEKDDAILRNILSSLKF